MDAMGRPTEYEGGVEINDSYRAKEKIDYAFKPEQL